MERCCGQAAMVHADHVNSWWGIELLIPLLKHTNEFYFCVKIPCATDANTWEVGTVGISGIVMVVGNSLKPLSY